MHTLDPVSERMVNLALGQHPILEMIALGSPLCFSMNALLRFLEKEMPDMFCSILLLDRDGVHLRHCAAPSLPEAYTRAIDGAAIGPRAGSCGTAAFRRERVIVADIETDPLWADYLELARPHGFRACWSTPIQRADGSVLGTFAMYFRTPGQPADYHKCIIELAVHVAAIAIGKHEREGDSQILMGELKERVKELTLLQQLAQRLLIDRPINSEFFEHIVQLLPSAWRYVDACQARISYHKWQVGTEAANDTPWILTEQFQTADGACGLVEVSYPKDIVCAAEGPFLPEERSLLRTLVEMLTAYLNRIRAEEALHESEERYRLINVATKDAVWDWDVVNGTLWWNDGLRLLFGYPKEEVSDNISWWVDRLHEDDRDRVHVGLKAAAESGSSAWAEEYRFRRRDGTYADICDRGYVMRDARGATVRMIGMMQDVSESKQTESKIRDLAYREPVTGLPNRAALQVHMAAAISEAEETNASWALLLLNLNYFRDINDSLGHQNGDLLLQLVADRLRRSLLPANQVASLGGDEFAVLLPCLDSAPDIEDALKQIHESLQSPFVVANIPLKVEATLGIAFYPAHGATVDLLWQHADVALRTAKERYERHRVYSPDIDHYDPSRLALLGELRGAIEENQLVLHYQPKIDLRSGRTIGAEALVRWKHPHRGMIFPDTFIPLAERTGLINPLTTAVVINALRQGVAFLQQGLALDISVNLSARNLHEPGFSEGLLAMVGAIGFPLRRLTLEITETAIMADPVRAKTVLTELRQVGIHLSMDDFGIGQSSLSYLKDLPISKMKIDKSFVMDFDQERNVTVVRSAIDLARNMGLQVTAEGVEEESTYYALRDLGCDLAQGYFFSKPLPVDQLTHWLRESPWGYPSALSQLRAPVSTGVDVTKFEQEPRDFSGPEGTGC